MTTCDANEYERLLPRLARAQARPVTEERASALYLGTLAAMLSGEQAILRDLREPGAGEYGDGEVRPGKMLIGWRDDRGVYLHPDLAFQAVCRFYAASGQAFGFTKQAVHEQLHSDGMLARVDGTGRWTAVKKIDGQSKRLLYLAGSALDGCDSATGDLLE